MEELCLFQVKDFTQIILHILNKNHLNIYKKRPNASKTNIFTCLPKTCAFGFFAVLKELPLYMSIHQPSTF